MIYLALSFSLEEEFNQFNPLCYHSIICLKSFSKISKNISKMFVWLENV